MKVDSRLHLSEKALLRYYVVSQVRARVLAGRPISAAVREIAGLTQVDPQGDEVSVSERTLYRWLRAYAALDLAGLEDKQRDPGPVSKVLDDRFLDFLKAKKRQDPEISLPDVIRSARVEGVLRADKALCRTSVWRAAKRLGLPLRRSTTLRDTDMRRFAYANRMLMVLCDGKHFRAGVKRRRRVALFFLDDATRYGLQAWVGTSESAELFLGGLHRLVLRYGLMSALYLDRGPGFISGDTKRVLAQLEVRFIHGRRRYPEGRGKVERFNRTLKGQLLRTMDGNPEINPDPRALTLLLNHFLDHAYNQTPHESLRGQTPAERFSSDSRELRFPSDARWLIERFAVTAKRTVSKDNVVRLHGDILEVPRGHAGERIQVTTNLLTKAVSILHDGKATQIHPPDLERNAYDPRALEPTVATTHKPSNANTAASIAFQRDMKPLVDEHGGFNPKGEHHDPDDPSDDQQPDS